MPGERDNSRPARARQRATAAAHPARALSAKPSADTLEAMLNDERTTCHALLAIYWELRRARARSTTVTPDSPTTTPFGGHDPARPGMGADAELPHLRREPCMLGCYLDQLLDRRAGGPGGVTPHTAVDAEPATEWQALPPLVTEHLVGTRSWQSAALNALHEDLLSGLAPTTRPAQDDVPGPLTPASLPPYLRRVVNAILANPAHPYTVAGLAELAGVKVRTLQQGFRSRLGSSPMAYLRSVRLARAHDDLISDDTSGVAEVAYRWGFTHLGRFAAVYAAQYGESPSRTRNRKQPG